VRLAKKQNPWKKREGAGNPLTHEAGEKFRGGGNQGISARFPEVQNSWITKKKLRKLAQSARRKRRRGEGKAFGCSVRNKNRSI